MRERHLLIFSVSLYLALCMISLIGCGELVDPTHNAKSPKQREKAPVYEFEGDSTGNTPSGQGSIGSKPGKAAFEAYCAACHQLDGSGVEGGGPPLAASNWVRGPESRLIRIVLHGVRGPIDVGERSYNREMLGFGPILSDEQIADLLTFVRARFGEGSIPVSPFAVGRVRANSGDRTDYWTVEELLEFR